MLGHWPITNNQQKNFPPGVGFLKKRRSPPWVGLCHDNIMARSTLGMLKFYFLKFFVPHLILTFTFVWNNSFVKFCTFTSKWSMFGVEVAMKPVTRDQHKVLWAFLTPQTILIARTEKELSHPFHNCGMHILSFQTFESKLRCKNCGRFKMQIFAPPL